MSGRLTSVQSKDALPILLTISNKDVSPIDNLFFFSFSLMIFHSFKNTEIVLANLKAHSSSLHEDGRKLNLSPFRESFFYHFNYVSYNFSDIIDISTLNHHRPF